MANWYDRYEDYETIGIADKYYIDATRLNSMVDRIWKTQEAINVKDPNNYGAYSDGTHPTITTTAIQDAIDDAEADGGGTVFLPSGTFLIDAKLNMKDNIKLTGSVNSTIKAEAGLANHMIDINSRSNVRIENLILNGNSTAYEVLYFHGASDNCIVSQCNIKYMVRSAVRFADSSAHATIVNNIITGNISGEEAGIHIRDVSRVYIGGNMIYNIALGSGKPADGIHLRIAEEIIIIGNILEDIERAGIYFDNSNYCIIANNTINNAGSDGIYVEGSKLTIKNNQIRKSQSNGIQIQPGSKDLADIIIEGNLLRNNNQASATAYGLLIDNTSYNILDCVITDNRIGGSNQQSAAIELKSAGDCRRAIVAENNLENNVGDSDLSKATWDSSSIIKDNIGFINEKSGNDLVSDGDTISHGLDETPTYVNLTASADRHIAVATAVDATNITVGLHDDTGTAVTVDETVYWEAEA